MAKKIVIVWQADYPWDIRIEKQLKTFSEQGWQVHIICRNQENKPFYENDGLIYIWRFKNFSDNSRINNFLSFPIYINPVWYFHINSVIKKIKPDAIIVRDLPLSLLVLNIARKYKILSIVDIAEHYPALIREISSKYRRNFILNFLLYKLNLYNYIERKVVKKIDKVFVVTEEQEQRFLRDYQANQDKINIVRNTPIILSPIFKTYQDQTNNHKTLKIIYTGRMEDKFRGLDTLIEAANLLRDKPVQFVIIGHGNQEEYLRNKIKALNINNIEFLGYISQNNIQEYIKSCDIGIIPHLKSELTDYTLPNKLFDYMAVGIPVISSDINPVRRIIEAENCGFIYESGNSFSLSQIIQEILDNKPDLYKSGKNGFEAVKRQYNWSIDSKIMIDVIN